MLRAPLALALILATVSSVSCQGSDEEDLPEVLLAQSEHFRLWARSSAQASVCPGEVEVLERRRDALERLLGFQMREGRVIDYYLFQDADDLHHSVPACSAAAACYWGNGIRTARHLDQHEFVHAVLDDLGSPTSLVSEGAAELFNCRGSIPAVPSVLPTWQETVRFQRSTGRGVSDLYTASARFMRALWDVAGSQGMHEFYAGAPHGSEESAFRQYFESHFSQSLDDFWARAMSAPYLGGFEVCPCSGTALARAAESLADRCDDQRGFSLQQTTTVTFDPEPILFSVLACDGSKRVPVPLGDGFSEGDVIQAVKLERGEYVMAGVEPAAQVRLSEGPEMLGDDCKSLTPAELDGTASFRLLFSPGAAVARLSTRGARARVRLLTGREGQFDDLRICSGCSSAVNDCTRVTYGELLASKIVSMPQDATLRLANSVSGSTAVLEITPE